MKAIVIFFAVLALGNAWVILPPLMPGQRPLPPGISPEIPVVPPRPELPGPTPPMVQPEVESHVLNFPSDEDPEIRIHVNIKQDSAPAPGHKPELPPIQPRSLLPPTNGPRPIPEGGHKPEIVPPPPGNLPEVGPHPEMPVLPAPEEDSPLVFIYPNVQHQLVKLRVQYNDQNGFIELPISGPSPYKLEWNPIGHKPAPGSPSVDPIFPGEPGNLPEGPEVPIIPMPPPVAGGKTPQIELFLDIGEQENY